MLRRPIESAVDPAKGGVDLGDLAGELVLGRRFGLGLARTGAGEVVVVGGAVDLQNPAYPLHAVSAPMLVSETESDQEP